MSPAAITRSAAHTTADFLALIKPRVTMLVIATTAGGFWLAPSHEGVSFLLTLVGVSLLVGGANTFNMYLERDVDARMRRTQNRPLPAKRLAPETAFVFGVLLTVTSVAILTLGVNPLTGFLGVISFILYVFFYTPLKQKTTMALLIGAIPGAMPPLLGWTAATNQLDLKGLSLFFILFAWQLPHFLAIALFNKEEYQKAGIKILPLEKGEAATKHWIARSLALMIPASLFPTTVGLAGHAYFCIAMILGILFTVWGTAGLRPTAGPGWARSFFHSSLIYLPLLFIALLVFRAS